MRRALLLVLPALAALALLAPAGAAAQSAPKCAAGAQFTCATLDVPVDRSGAVPGTVTLHYAVQKRGAGRPLLLALAGGPGQGAVPFADSFALSLQPLLSKFRLVVLDQRGTGASGPINCPEIQKLGSVDLVSPVQIAGCANRIGPRRAFYGTADSVADIDALRDKLGAGKLALFGISYGTFVAVAVRADVPRARRPPRARLGRGAGGRRPVAARQLPQPAAPPARAVREQPLPGDHRRRRRRPRPAGDHVARRPHARPRHRRRRQAPPGHPLGPRRAGQPRHRRGPQPAAAAGRPGGDALGRCWATARRCCGSGARPTARRPRSRS